MYIKRNEQGEIISSATKPIKIYDNKKKDYIEDLSFEKIDEKSQEFLDFKNSTGMYEKAKKPNYNHNTMWEILEKEIPALKEYRESVREEI